eukprot:TRINITY_DN3398_c0_g1_i1.p1 TRINITY_DN3398_c0_g1~~TRINITY_DN3398_c0_g1_i1.p1  ORF type:complete len:407 (+),score=109.90 TRINITY_DN3398_c0_g1_i1:44-1264(+)
MCFVLFFFFFFKQKTAYEMQRGLVGSEMCIRDRYQRRVHGKQIHKMDPTISSDLRSALCNNYAAYYEKTEEYSLALFMIDEAIKLDTEARDEVAIAIDHNNKTVVLLHMQKTMEAYKSSKRSLLILEPIVFSLMKAKSKSDLIRDRKFTQKLYVLIMIYYNLGETQDKLGEREKATECFDQGQKITENYLGLDHYFVEKFKKRKVTVGSNMEPETEEDKSDFFYYNPVEPQYKRFESEEETLPKKSIRLEPLGDSREDSQKDSLINQLSAQNRAQLLEISKYKQLLKEQKADIPKRKNKFPVSLANIQKRNIEVDDSSILSQDKDVQPSVKEGSVINLTTEKEEGIPQISQEELLRRKDEEMRKREEELLEKAKKDIEEANKKKKSKNQKKCKKIKKSNCKKQCYQ